ncbi:MAG: NAD(P)/FAD-dependent oxidoreductase [archaeon]
MQQLIILGAGPAGLSAGLRAKELKLNYLILEQGEIAQTFLETYPRGKDVADFPKDMKTKGNLWFERCSVENLLDKWKETANELKIKTNQEVLEIQKQEIGFTIKTSEDTYESENVIIAIGKQAKPNKLGVEGEDLKKVFYNLKDPEDFNNKNIMIVGGGDSAIDAALRLSKKNKIIISYRKPNFFRLNEDNSANINQKKQEGIIETIFNSNLKEIKEDKIILEVNNQEREIENDFVFIFAGSKPPLDFFEKTGVKIENNKVVLDENFQTSIKNLYLIGDAASKPPLLIKPAINQGYDVVERIAERI